MATATVPGVATASTGAAVFGSYVNRDYALQHGERIAGDLGVRVVVLEIDIDGDRHHRVASEALAEEDARELIRRADASGHAAWYLAAVEPHADESTVEAAPPATAQRRKVAEPVRPAPAIAAQEPAAPAAASSASVPPDPDPVAAAQPEAPAAPPTLASRTVARGLPPTTDDDATPIISATRMTDADIVIDGHVDEAAWEAAPAYDNMRVMEPETLAAPTYATASRFIYTDRGLYVSAVMEQPPASLVARLSSRDQYLQRDSYGITLDTSGEGLYGYWFTVSLGGSLADGKVAAERSFTRQWDGPWHGASAVTETGWSVEMFLPWAMMSMPQTGPARTLGFWVDRKVAHMDERYSWPVLPFTSPRFMSALKPMAFAQVSPAKQWAVFPYTSATADPIRDENTAKAGVDVTWRPSTNLQLTAALNPDFGAVESDDVVINLTAFETFFPEKRLFFLEGNEVFVTSPRANPQSSQSGPQGQGARRSPSTFSREPTTLLNTRRIGGKARHVTIPDHIDVTGVEASKPTDLLGAAKLVGQSGGLRYGVLAAAEDEVALRGTCDGLGVGCADIGADTVFRADGRNFGAARVVFEQSTAGGRRGIGYMGTLVDKSYDTATVHGIDTHWLGGNGKIEWDTQLLASRVDDIPGYGIFMDLTYSPRIGSFHRFALEYLEPDLNVGDFGFIRRNDAVSAMWGTFQYISKGLPRRLRNIRASLFGSYEQNTDGLLTRAGVFAGVGFTFLDNSQLRLMLNYFPKRWDDWTARSTGAFRISDRLFAQAQYGTDSAKPLALSVALGVDGEEQGGSAFLFDTGFTYTPFDRFSIDFDLRYKDRDGWLVHRGDGSFTTYSADDVQPRIAVDLFLTARQQLRLTTQWAGIKAEQLAFFDLADGGGALAMRDEPEDSEDFVVSRLTAQLRYRWEIQPMSDLFVVYTRGGNLPYDHENDGFGNLFLDAVETPVVDVFVVKLRYRFGS